MEFRIDFGLTPEAALLTTSGIARVAGFREMNQALVDHPLYRAGMPILVDHTALDVRGLTATDVRSIGQFVATIGDQIGSSPIAVVVPDQLTFGLVRMSETRADQPQFNLKIFYSRAEAVEWLQEQQPTDPVSAHP